VEVCHESPKVGCASSACVPGLQLGRMFIGFSVFLPQAKTLPASTGMRHVLQGGGSTSPVTISGALFHSAPHAQPQSECPAPSPSATQGGAACRTQSQLCLNELHCPLFSRWRLSPSYSSQSWLKKRENLPPPKFSGCGVRFQDPDMFCFRGAWSLEYKSMSF